VDWERKLFEFSANQNAELTLAPNFHVAPVGHIILIPGQPVFDLSLNAVCLEKKQQIPIV
jgi:hypothetical protein